MLGAAYDKKMILDQIQAVPDAGVSGCAIWNARKVSEPAYLEKLPEPNRDPPLKLALLEVIRKREMAKAEIETAKRCQEERAGYQKAGREVKEQLCCRHLSVFRTWLTS